MKMDENALEEWFIGHFIQNGYEYVNGNEIANIHATENRMPVKIAQIPKDLQNAFIAVEDARFYEHSGIDPRGILRALWANISGGGVSEGGSTITQQLAMRT